MYEILKKFHILKKPLFHNKYEITKSIKNQCKAAKDKVEHIKSQLLNDNSEYIPILIEAFENNEISKNYLEELLKEFKKAKMSYENLRVLFKICEHDKDFITEFIDNIELSIILGEYCTKYEFYPYKIKNSVVFLVSYLCTYNFILHDYFEKDIEFILKNICQCTIKDLLECLILNVNDLNSIERLQKIINDIFEIQKNKSMKKILHKKEFSYDITNNVFCNNKNCSIEIDNQKDFYLDLVFDHDNFFKKNNFIEKLSNNLTIHNNEQLKSLNKYYKNFHINNVLINTRDDKLIEILLESDKNIFTKYHSEIFSRKEIINHKNYYKIAFLCKYYNLSFEMPKNKTLEIEFLRDKENLNFSSSFINGLSFVDNLCLDKSENILKFLDHHKCVKKTNFEKIFEKFEFNCFFDLNDTKRFENELKIVAICNFNVFNIILENLSKFNNHYEHYIKIEKIPVLQKKIDLI
ncbi:hypothetical protein GVAV_002972 [Gurleya vavrai]